MDRTAFRQFLAYLRQFWRNCFFGLVYTCWLIVHCRSRLILTMYCCCLCRSRLILTSDRPNPVFAKPNRTEPFFCRTMFGRTERFGQGSANMAEPVRLYWPNMFGHICRTCSVVFAESVRPNYYETTDCEIYLLTDHK